MATEMRRMTRVAPRQMVSVLWKEYYIPRNMRSSNEHAHPCTATDLHGRGQARRAWAPCPCQAAWPASWHVRLHARRSRGTCCRPPIQGRRGI